MSKTTSFYGLWICYVIGALAGLMAIGVAKPAGLEVAANAGIARSRHNCSIDKPNSSLRILQCRRQAAYSAL